jgi:hypothetical protein
VQSTELAMASFSSNFGPKAIIASNGKGDVFMLHGSGRAALELVIAL